MKNIETSLFLNDFVTEAKSHVEKVEAAFLDVESLSGDYQAMNSVFRAAHSLKGTAGFFSLKKIVTVAHELESVFLQIQDGKLTINDKMVDAVLESIDCLNDLIDHTGDDSGIIIDDVLTTLREFSRLEEIEDTDVKKTPFDFNKKDTREILQNAIKFGHKIYYIHINFNKDLGRYFVNPRELLDNFLSVGTVAEIIIKAQEDTNPLTFSNKGNVVQMSESVVELLSTGGNYTLDLLVTSILEFDLFSIAIEIDKSQIRLLHNETIFGIEAPTGPAPKKQSEPTKEITPKKVSEQDEGNFYIRLDINVINGLLDLANEMILTRNQLFSSISGYEKIITGLPPILQDLNRLTSEIQEKVMYTRMQPIGVVFSKFPRIIRDTAKSLGKEIAVEIPANEVTLDKYMLEALTDPITQLVKNSADHGLEPAERRMSLGKPAKGVITLNAFIRDGFAIIEVSDDGGGIDANSLKRKALDRGISTEEALAEMTKNEIFNLMFEPGISTARKITNYSGRGVGMDIVKTNIENLGGSIEIDSEVDVGTTVRLKVPLTLSVIRSLIVTMDSVPYAVPELNVERIVRVWNTNTSKHIEKVNNALVLSLDGQIIPVVTIHDIEGKASGVETMPPDEMLEQIKRFGVVKCLVLRASGKYFALLIDDALETEQVLVKPLPVYLNSCLCYSNVTVLGSGKAVMILDADGIMRFMGVGSTEEEITAIHTDTSDPNDESSLAELRRQIMLFNCSGSEYFAVDIEDISRIESVKREDIQEIGKEYYVNVADETIRIVRPEDYSPVRRRTYTEDVLYLLNLKNTESPVGLLIKKVIDKVEDYFALDCGQVTSQFVTGTSAYNEKVLIFLDTKAIVQDVEKKKKNKRIVRKGGPL